MSQHDFVISNQGFPAFRSDLNDFLSAVKTTHSGTSRPSGAAAGTIWLDTTSATTPTLKYYDGADDISLATIDHSANTVNWLDSNVSVTGLTTTATGTVITLSDTANTTTVNLIIDNQKEVRFRELTANGTNYVGLKAPASLSTDTTFTLPSADGTNGQALITNGSGTLSFSTISTSLATPLEVVGNATAGAEIRLPEDTDNGSNYVALKAANSIASNVTFTLPSADGSANQVLQTNGSGVLSFASVSGGILQVKQTVKTDTSNFSLSSNTTTDVTGLSVTITPASASNKILLIANVCHVKEDNGNPTYMGFIFRRDSTAIGVATSVGNRNALTFPMFRDMSSYTTVHTGMTYLDNPSSTSSITYKIALQTGNYAQTSAIFINRGNDDSNDGYNSRYISTLTAIEIASSILT